MDLRQNRALQLFRRVKAFLERVTPSLAHGDVATHTAALGDVIATLAANAVTQNESVRETKAAGVARSQALRRLTDGHMRPLARIAGTLFPDDQTLLDTLAMPRQGTRAPEVVAAARAMANAAQQHLSRLQAAGFAPDFPDRLRAMALAVEDSLGQVRAQRGRRAAATSAAIDEVQRGRRIVKTLDPAVRVALIGDADKLGEWTSLVRLGRVPRSRTPVVAPPPTGGSVTPPTPGSTVPPVGPVDPVVPASPPPAPVGVTPAVDKEKAA